MNTHLPSLRRSFTLLSCLLVLFTASCTTTTEVRDLVNASNVAALSADLN